MSSLPIVHQPGTTARETWYVRLSMASASGVVPTGVPLHPWTLGFKQSSLNPIAQASRGRALHAFPRSPLYQHALVPSAFRLQVSWFASKFVPELRPISSGIISVRTTAHRLRASGSTGNIMASGKLAPLARLVRPGLPGDAPRLNGVTETC